MTTKFTEFARRVSPAFLTITLFGFIPALNAQHSGRSPFSQSGSHWTVETSWSSKASLADSRDRGDIALTQTRLGAKTRIALAEDAGLTLGVDAQWLHLDSSQEQGLPDKLHSHAAPIYFDYRLSKNWQGILLARPGVYADTTTINGDTFNVPVGVSFAYTTNPNLAWQFGFRYDRFSDYELIPLIGVRWQFLPEWSLNIGFPRSGVFWKFSQEITLDIHFGMLGGNYRTTREYTPTNQPFAKSTADTYLDIREIRTGVGADWQLTGGLRVRLEAGLATDRKFEYFERGINLDGKAAGYLSLSMNGSF